MEYQQILNNLKNKIYSPIYFFHGEEPFFIDQLISFMEKNIIPKENIDFNRIILYGRDVIPRELLLTARGFPMVPGYLLVIVKEAQDIKNYNVLEEYIKSPTPSTILAFGFKHKKFDKRKTFYKLMAKSKNVVIYESKKLYDNQLPYWIEKWVLEMGFNINPKATMLLSDHLGTDLSRINNELQKLTIFLKPGNIITVDHVDKNIGISKDFNVFELNNAIGKKDVFKALRIVQYFEANPKHGPLQLISTTLYNFFIKILLVHYNNHENKFKLASIIGVSPNFVNDYISAAHNYPANKIPQIVSMIKNIDLKSKGIGTLDANGYGPLKELIMKLCL